LIHLTEHVLNVPERLDYYSNKTSLQMDMDVCSSKDLAYLIHQQLKMAPVSYDDQLMENNGLLKIKAKSA